MTHTDSPATLQAWTRHPTAPETLVDAIRYFSDPDICLAFLVELRWPDGVTCPTCGSRAVSFISTRRGWKCREQHARRQFSIKVGTIFEDSPLGLDKWFPAVWMIVNDKNGDQLLRSGARRSASRRRPRGS